MVPLIEKFERQIVAGGLEVAPGATQEELEKFARDTSNPENVKEYLKKWNDPEANLLEGLEGEEEDSDSEDDIEVVVSEDEEEDSDSGDDEELDDFFVEDSKTEDEIEEDEN